MVNAICEKDYALAIKYGESIPAAFKDSNEIVEFANILDTFDEKDRDSYSNVLKKLKPLSVINNAKVKPIYRNFKNKIANLQYEYEKDQETAKELIQRINTFAAYTSDDELLANEAQINLMRNEIDETDYDVRSLITNIYKLDELENKIIQLKDAKNVINLIESIGTVTLDSKDKIDKANSAYEDLPEETRQYVTNYQKLTNASNEFNQLKLKEEQKKAEEEKAKEKEAFSDFVSSGNGDYGTYQGATVYYVSGGSVYHSTPDCPTLSRSKNILSGSPPSGRRPCKVCY